MTVMYTIETFDRFYNQGKKYPKITYPSIDVDIPCRIDAAYKKWLEEGNTGTFSIMMVCHCPKCSSKCGSL